MSKGDKAEFYWPQLAAYDYILSNPKQGTARTCETLGLLVWEIRNVSPGEGDEYRVGFNAAYEPVEVNPSKFESFISEVVSVLMGPMPDSAEKCSNCGYYTQRAQLDH